MRKTHTLETLFNAGMVAIFLVTAMLIVWKLAFTGSLTWLQVFLPLAIVFGAYVLLTITVIIICLVRKTPSPGDNT